MAFFIDRWYEEPENLYYKGWLTNEILDTEAEYVVSLDGFHFTVESLNFNFDIDEGDISKALQVVSLDIEVAVDGFDFDVFLGN